MNKIEEEGPGCKYWMRISDFEYDLHLFYYDCYFVSLKCPETDKYLRVIRPLRPWVTLYKTLTELEQNATQESSQGRNEEAEAGSS